MSDTFISIVSEKTKQSDSKRIAEKVLRYLTENRIVKSELTDCVLSGNGHEPAENFISILENPNNGLLELSVNGLQILTERQVFDNGGNGLDGVLCPNCGGNQIEENWGNALENWQDKTQSDNFKCSNCSLEFPITAFQFEPKWGFGNFGITFWNWGELKSEFIIEIESVIGTELKVVRGLL
ncbi:hypothetical protein [Maribacter aquivivus]|uniref:hypothetical protein n=2 Tax=Flavobacteriaceae TaxID=49546 RepID=UPI002491C4E1|nr:hypothetical protein [Maribacter aquivivus]